MKIRSSRCIEYAKCQNALIMQGDAFEFLSKLNSECADLVFLDPPFNLGKQYGRRDKTQDKQLEPDYQFYMESVLSQAIRIIRPGGALYLYHIPKWAIAFSTHLSRFLTFQHWIAITMKNGFVRGRGLYPAHYALLFFTKGEPRAINRPKIPVPTCRHCDKTLKDYGGYKEYVRNGVNLSDFWEDTSPVRHAKYKTRVPNELPGLIPSRVLTISGRRNGLFVDPFSGSGTPVIHALKQGMRIAACDIEPKYCKLIAGRIKDLQKEGHNSGKDLRSRKLRKED